MTLIAFDTLKYSKKLLDAGFTKSQAEGQAEALAEVVDSHLATKQDLKDLETRLTNKLMLRLGSLVVVSTTIAVAILGVLISAQH